MLTFTPRDYQSAGIDLMLAQPGVGLLLEPGSGKTVTALTAADILMNEQLTVEKTLVVAPKMVAQEVWTRETAKWKHTAHLQIRHLDAAVFEYYRRVTTSAIWGEECREIVENNMTEDDAFFLFMADVAISKSDLVPGDWRKVKANILKDKAQIHVVSRDHLYVLAKILGDDWPYDLVLADESTSFKSPDSKRSLAIRYLRKEDKVKRLTLMSGTVSPKGLENLHAQVLLLDGGARLGKHITKFRERFMLPGQKGRNPHTGRRQVFNWTAKPGAIADVTDKIKDICLSVRADAWRETDPPRTVERVVSLPETAMAMYRELEDTLQVTLDSGADISAPQAAVLCNKLIQVASGAVFDDEKVWHEIHTAKLDALDELIEELDGQPLLLAYWFKPTLARLKKRYGNKLATKETKGFIDRFAAGELPLLALQPASAGHGLDGLQMGGHHLAVIDLFYDWEYYQQIVSRLDRSGQRHQVTVHQFLAAGTRDRYVARVLADRAASQGEVMDRLRYNGRGV